MASEESLSETKRCWRPLCDRPQEFPDGPCRSCLDHSLQDYFVFRPLAEFGPIVPGWGGS